MNYKMADIDQLLREKIERINQTIELRKNNQCPAPTEKYILKARPEKIPEVEKIEVYTYSKDKKHFFIKYKDDPKVNTIIIKTKKGKISRTKQILQSRLEREIEKLKNLQLSQENDHDPQYRMRIFDNESQPLCYAVGCSVRKNLIVVRNGMFCEKHYEALNYIRDKIKSALTIEDEREWRLRELCFRKDADYKHIQICQELENMLDK
jgi:hypothetical protein